MARIRSVHPGFYTDEDIVSVSMAARLCLIGLGTEADDKGIFEWKPIQLKIKLFPADNIDVSELLDELKQGKLLKSYEIDGRKYGAIRNFRRFQRPKKPNDIYPILDEFRAFVGLTDESSELGDVKPPTVPPKGEKSPQMEDGGEDGVPLSNDNGQQPSLLEEKSDGEIGPVSDPVKVMFDSGIALFRQAGIPEKQTRSFLGKKRKEHGEANVIAAIAAAKREGAVQPLEFVEGSLRHRHKPDMTDEWGDPF